MKNKKTEELVDIIVKGLQERKGQEIVVMNLTKIKSSLCDYFVICHGSSNTQVGALADSVQEEVFKTIKVKASHKEGYENAEWILLDYFDVVVHVFQEHSRRFYQLEDLWADAPIKTINSEY